MELRSIQLSRSFMTLIIGLVLFFIGMILTLKAFAFGWPIALIMSGGVASHMGLRWLTRLCLLPPTVSCKLSITMLLAGPVMLIIGLTLGTGPVNRCYMVGGVLAFLIGFGGLNECMTGQVENPLALTAALRNWLRKQ